MLECSSVPPDLNATCYIVEEHLERCEYEETAIQIPTQALPATILQDVDNLAVQSSENWLNAEPTSSNPSTVPPCSWSFITACTDPRIITLSSLKAP